MHTQIDEAKVEREGGRAAADAMLVGIGARFYGAGKGVVL
jgi:hypothetical protein